MTQRELADHMGASQPRIVAIEKSRSVAIDVLDAYVSALGGRLEVSVREQAVALACSVSQQPSG